MSEISFLIESNGKVMEWLILACRWGELQQCWMAVQQRSVCFGQYALWWTSGLQRSFRRGGLCWTSTMQHAAPLSEEPGVSAGRVDMWWRGGLQGWHGWEGALGNPCIEWPKAHYNDSSVLTTFLMWDRTVRSLQCSAVSSSGRVPLTCSVFQTPGAVTALKTAGMEATNLAVS